MNKIDLAFHLICRMFISFYYMLGKLICGAIEKRYINVKIEPKDKNFNNIKNINKTLTFLCYNIIKNVWRAAVCFRYW